MSRRVVLIRHGETSWNAAGRWQGHDGPGLSARGHAQAARTAAAVSRLQPDVARLVVSDLQRAEETAAPLHERLGCPAVQDPRWREIDVGTWAGLTHREVAAQDPQGFAVWSEGEDVRRGGGETDADLHARVGAALDELWQGEGTVVVVTHGGPVRHATAHALGLGPTGRHHLAHAANCGLTTLQRGRHGWRLAGYNDAAHLDVASDLPESG